MLDEVVLRLGLKSHIPNAFNEHGVINRASGTKTSYHLLPVIYIFLSQPWHVNPSDENISK